MNHSLPVALTLLALLATACPEQSSSPPMDAAVASLDASRVPDVGGISEPDASEPADGGGISEPDASEAADGGGISEPDAGTLPLRTLLPVHLMGEAPLDNLVIAPDFDPAIGHWYGDGAQGMYVQTLPRTPVPGLPVLKLGFTGRLAEFYSVGNLRGGSTTLLASMWVGRDVSDTASLLVDFAVQGLTPTGSVDEAFALAPEPETEQTLDGIRWIRYSGKIEQGLLGLGMVTISGYRSTNLYIHAPVVLNGSTTRSLTKRPTAIKRKATAMEAKAVASMLEQMRRRPPPPRIRP